MPTSATRQLLLVEDNPVAAHLLAGLLRQAGYQVLGPVATAAEALKLRHRHPALTAAVLDLHLGIEPDGAELAALLQMVGAVPVVFLTGCTNEARLAEARQLNPCALLPKGPELLAIAPELCDALAQAVQLPPRPAHAGALPLPVFLRTGKGRRRLALPELCYFECLADAVCAVCVGGSKHRLSMSLRELTLLLAPAGFVRVHRSYLINLTHLEAFNADDTALTVHRAELPLSRQRRDLLLACLSLLD